MLCRWKTQFSGNSARTTNYLSQALQLTRGNLPTPPRLYSAAYYCCPIHRFPCKNVCPAPCQAGGDGRPKFMLSVGCFWESHLKCSIFNRGGVTLWWEEGGLCLSRVPSSQTPQPFTEKSVRKAWKTHQGWRREGSASRSEELTVTAGPQTLPKRIVCSRWENASGGRCDLILPYKNIKLKRDPHLGFLPQVPGNQIPLPMLRTTTENPLVSHSKTSVSQPVHCNPFGIKWPFHMGHIRYLLYDS